jgi:hypothetical protein
MSRKPLRRDEGRHDPAADCLGARRRTTPPSWPKRTGRATTSRARDGLEATQKHIATMNGAQQLRLNQAINALPEMLDSVDALASKWKGGRFPILNKREPGAGEGRRTRERRCLHRQSARRADRGRDGRSRQRLHGRQLARRITRSASRGRASRASGTRRCCTTWWRSRRRT